jgi:hypothetical protein
MINTLPPHNNSLQGYARLAGVLYLVIIVAGLFGEMFVRAKLLVSGDPAATASNIMHATDLWRMGIVGDLIMQVCDLPVMWALYILLRPINRNLALLNLLFNLIQTAVLVANKLSLVMVLFLLGDNSYLSAFEPQQLQTLSYLFIKLHDYGFGIGLIFFGFVCLIEGYLIMRSGFLPKVLGYGMLAAGICYLINTFALLLTPQLSGALFPYVLVPPFLAELSLALWLTIKGVDVTKWQRWVKASS